MKTKELIRQLQEADPTGELEVTVGKEAIWFVQTLPGYYDGCHQVLKHDPDKVGKEFSIVGAEIRAEGRHLDLEIGHLEHLLVDEPDMPVTYDSEYARSHYASMVEDWRKEAREIIERVRK